MIAINVINVKYDMMLLLSLQEAYVLSECITVLDSNTDKSIFCATGEIIQIEDVTLYRSNSRTHCEALDPSNVSPYPCQTMSTKVTDTIWRRCHGQNNCYYELEYPDEDDCPVDYQRDRIILLVISLQCVSRKYMIYLSVQIMMYDHPPPKEFCWQNYLTKLSQQEKGLVLLYNFYGLLLLKNPLIFLRRFHYDKMLFHKQIPFIRLINLFRTGC